MLIPHPRPLHACTFLARYDRFIADVRFEDGKIDRAHCVNPGRMEGLVRPGAAAWVSAAPQGSQRKLGWTLELLEIEGQLVGANTQTPNQIAEALIRARQLPGLKRWRRIEREVPYGERSRIDLMLRGATDHLVEVKNCHLVYPDGRAYFPDSVSDRAARHVEDLAAQVGQGLRASVLFIVQRPDGRSLRPSRLHDPAFADAVMHAAARGVRFRAARVRPTLDGYQFERMVPVDLGAYDCRGLHAYRDALDKCSGWRRRPKASG